MPRKKPFHPNDNHPKKGSSIKVEPIKDLKAIKRIKKLLADKPRDLCIFTLGINTAYRANELVALKVGQVDHLQAGDRLDVKQSKNGRYRATTLNETVIEAIDHWLKVHPNPKPSAPLFPSQVGGKAITTYRLISMVKQWTADVGLRGNYGSHTLRKTFGYHQRKTFGKPLSLLTRAYGHSSEWQTLEYLCIQPEELDELYAGAL